MKPFVTYLQQKKKYIYIYIYSLKILTLCRTNSLVAVTKLTMLDPTTKKNPQYFSPPSPLKMYNIFYEREIERFLLGQWPNIHHHLWPYMKTCYLGGNHRPASPLVGISYIPVMFLINVSYTNNLLIRITLAYLTLLLLYDKILLFFFFFSYDLWGHTQPPPP